MLLGVHRFPADEDGLGRRFFLEIVHRLQPSGDLLDGEVLEVEEGLNRDVRLGVLLRCRVKKLLHRPLLVEVLVAVAGHLLLPRGETEGKVFDLLTWT